MFWRGSLNSDFWPLELSGKKVLLFKATQFGYFFTATLVTNTDGLFKDKKEKKKKTDVSIPSHSSVQFHCHFYFLSSGLFHFRSSSFPNYSDSRLSRTSPIATTYQHFFHCYFKCPLKKKKSQISSIAMGKGIRQYSQPTLLLLVFVICLSLEGKAKEKRKDQNVTFIKSPYLVWKRLF